MEVEALNSSRLAVAASSSPAWALR